MHLVQIGIQYYSVQENQKQNKFSNANSLKKRQKKISAFTNFTLWSLVEKSKTGFFVALCTTHSKHIFQLLLNLTFRLVSPAVGLADIPLVAPILQAQQIFHWQHLYCRPDRYSTGSTYTVGLADIPLVVSTVGLADIPLVAPILQAQLIFHWFHLGLADIPLVSPRPSRYSTGLTQDQLIFHWSHIGLADIPLVSHRPS